jgi:hypothetical protein
MSVIHGLLEFIGGVVVVLCVLSFVMAYQHTKRMRSYLQDPQPDERNTRARDERIFGERSHGA